MEDQKSAEKSISELKKEMEAMRAQFFRLEAELRDTCELVMWMMPL